MPVIAAFDESDYTPFLPACRYTVAQNTAAMGKETVRRILERITQRKKGGGEFQENQFQIGNTGPQIIRLPVIILNHFQDR
jgi:DNA-binding LacI/PurR family transcriptional regulator